MASYMPSFMSKNLSTGAEAAYGQPFAFTTGAKGRTAAGTTQTSGKEKKANKKKNKAKKAANTTQVAEITVAVIEAMKKRDAKHLTTSAHSTKKKDKRLKLNAENLARFQAAKKNYLEQLVGITSTINSTYDNYQDSKAKAYQSMMQKKIDILKSQASDTYTTYENAKPSAAANKTKKHIAHIEKDNAKLHISKKGLRDDLDFTEFNKIMHAYYTAELAAVEMKGKEKRDKLKEAKQAKSAALKDWAKAPATDETEPDTRSDD